MRRNKKKKKGSVWRTTRGTMGQSVYLHLANGFEDTIRIRGCDQEERMGIELESELTSNQTKRRGRERYRNPG